MLSLLLAKIAPYLGGLIVLLGALWGVKRSGVKQEQAAETAKALTQAKESNAINQDVRNLSDADLSKRLSRDQRN